MSNQAVCILMWNRIINKLAKSCYHSAYVTYDEGRKIIKNNADAEAATDALRLAIVLLVLYLLDDTKIAF